MKNVIITTGFALLLVISLVFNSDIGNYFVLQTQLKSTTELCLAGAVQYKGELQYAEGYYVFKDEDIIKYVSLVAGIDDFTLYLFDDQLYTREYKREGGKPARRSASNVFSYGSVFTDPYGKQTVIKQPTIVVILSTDRFSFRQGFDANTIRSSMYVVEGR